jgi:hypothetical protein
VSSEKKVKSQSERANGIIKRLKAKARLEEKMA